MRRALIAMHFQNDICEPAGRIPFARGDAVEMGRFLGVSRRALEGARARGDLVAHVHIAFAPNYSDLPRNCRLFLATEALGAVKTGSWGAAPAGGFAPAPGELALVHRANSAFYQTGLEQALRDEGVTEIAVMGLATQYSVEHTVRDAADRGFGVTLLRDCCASANPKAAAATFEAMQMLADVRDSADWLAAGVAQP
jgi:nicotinamidase-related amidase